MSRQKRSPRAAKHAEDQNVFNFNKFVKQQQARRVMLHPKSDKQKEYIELLNNWEKMIVVATGPAGTGKTFLAVLAGIKALKDKEVDRIVLTRPAIGADDEKHGFLPGTIDDKLLPWTRPIFDVMQDYYSLHELAQMREEQIIELSPLAFMRGRSFHNCWIIADEMQNASVDMTKMVMTRIGEGCKLIVTGDTKQTDRPGNSNGLIDFQRRSNNFTGHKHIAGLQFTREDVQRHAVVAEVLKLYGED